MKKSNIINRLERIVENASPLAMSEVIEVDENKLETSTGEALEALIRLLENNQVINDEDCKTCANYLDEEFMNANCGGCSHNPFYINCYRKKD